jgi:glycine/serine hydroxymethyltransferase
VTITREELLASLEQQRRELGSSIVLTPVDSLPFVLADREHTAFLHGLYLTDKARDRQASKEALILFGGREAAGRDIALIHRLLAKKLGAADASLRLLSGLQAHAAIFMSIGKIGQSVLVLPEEAGGHFSTHAILQRLGLQTIDFPVDYDRLCIDRAETLGLIERTRPDFVFVDRSEGLRYEDFAFLGSLEGVTKVFDASQYLTPILTGTYANPLDWGFDLMLFTLHKSFPGPQKAGIVTREKDEVWKRLVKGLGMLVSSSHAENTYLLGLALLRQEWLERFAARLTDNAEAIEAELIRRGVSVVERSLQGQPEWPATHHLWIRSTGKEEALALYEALAAIGIHCNYRKLPYRLGHGLRLGTTHATVAGLEPADAVELADILAGAADGSKTEFRKRVKSLAGAMSEKSILPSDYWLTNG